LKPLAIIVAAILAVAPAPNSIVDYHVLVIDDLTFCEVRLWNDDVLLFQVDDCSLAKIGDPIIGTLGAWRPEWPLDKANNYESAVWFLEV
jgi:hypothetical protein